MHLYDDPATPFVADFIGQANLLYGTLVSVEDKYGIVDVAGRKVKARMGVLNPPKVGGKALLIVRIIRQGESERKDAVHHSRELGSISGACVGQLPRQGSESEL